MRNATQTDVDLTSVTQRLNLIDGQNLASTQIGSIADLQKQVTGVKTDLQQVCLSITTAINQIAADITALKASFTSLAH